MWAVFHSTNTTRSGSRIWGWIWTVSPFGKLFVHRLSFNAARWWSVFVISGNNTFSPRCCRQAHRMDSWAHGCHHVWQVSKLQSMGISATFINHEQNDASIKQPVVQGRIKLCTSLQSHCHLPGSEKCCILRWLFDSIFQLHEFSGYFWTYVIH